MKKNCFYLDKMQFFSYIMFLQEVCIEDTEIKIIKS